MNTPQMYFIEKTAAFDKWFRRLKDLKASENFVQNPKVRERRAFWRLQSFRRWHKRIKNTFCKRIQNLYRRKKQQHYFIIGWR